MPIEFYKEHNIPEEPSVSMGREQEVMARLSNRPEGKSSSEMEVALNKIDFSKLNNLFSEVAEKYGIERNKINFLGPERIFGTNPGLFSGSYQNDGNIILIGDRLKNHPEKNQNEIDEEKFLIDHFGSLEMAFLSTIVHEETHAVGRNFCVGRFNILDWDQHDFDYSESGYSKKVTGTKHRKENGDVSFAPASDFYVAFNEGVTERLSREILFRYAESSTYPSPEMIDKYKEGLMDNKHVYTEEVDLVSFVLSRLSQETGQSEDFWWDSIVRGYFLGGELDKPETQEIFNKAFGADFLKHLSTAMKHGESFGVHSLKSLMEKYKNQK